MAYQHIRALVVNVRKKKNISEYVEYANKNDYDILAMNEFSGRPDDVNNANLFYDTSSVARVAVLKLKQGLEIELVFMAEHEVTIKFVESSIVASFWYLPPSRGDIPALNKLINILSKKGKRRRIHTGDWNARHKTTGDWQTTQRGRDIIKAAALGDYNFINDIGTPTFGNKGAAYSIIDWTYVSKDLVDRVKWEALPASLGSDHEFISLTIQAKGANHAPEKRRMMVKPAKFLTKIKELNQQHGLEKWYEDYQGAVAHALTPAKARKKEDDSELILYLRKCIDVLRKKIKHGDGNEAENRQELRELSRQLNEEVSENQRRRRIDCIKNADDTSLYRDLLKPTGSTATCSKIKTDDGWLMGRQAAEELINHFFPKQDRIAWILPKQLPEDDPPFTVDEVQTALKEFETGKAPGYSGVSMELVNKWFLQNKKYVVDLLNDWLEKGIFPEPLKKTWVKPILKNKHQPPTKNNVRPISLSECPARLYEKLLDTRLMFHLEKNKLLSPVQFGFRERRSVESAVSSVMKQRLANMKLNELVIQLDVKSAFDSIKHVALVQAILEARIPGNLAKVISDYLVNRKAMINLGDEPVETDVRRGVPQGSCLGPHLYILATNATLEAARRRMNASVNSKSAITSYADDMVITIATERPESFLIKKAEEYLQLIAKQLEKVGLTLATEKTKLMFTGQGEERTINVLGKELVTKASLKILGIQMKYDRSMDEHMRYVERKTDEWIRAQRGLFHRHSGLSLYLRKKAITTVLAPKVTYGACAWWPFLKPADKLVLKNVSATATRAMTFAPNKAGYVSTTILSRTEPLDLLCEHKYLNFKKLNEDGVEQKTTSVDLGHPATRKRRDYISTITTAQQIEDIKTEVMYFTDGSRTEQEDGQVLVGAAYVKYVQGMEPQVCLMKLRPENTVFQAEITAIEVCLEDIDDQDNNCVSYTILSDSLSSIMSICGTTKCSYYANQCRKLLNKLEARGFRITLAHVKAHAGLEQNEAADTQAKQAAIDGEPTEVMVSRAAVKRRNKEEMTRKLKKRIQTDRTGTTIKSFFSNVDDPS